jgi:pyrroloquinoline quinone (PQQ) biosynthesis protein C
MNTAVARIENRIGRDVPVVEAEGVYDECLKHPALDSLNSFNHHMATRPLTGSELRLFLASMAAFNRHTVAGIAILAGRLSDELLPFLSKTAHEIGAYVLDAAVDEYGLRESITHVELARNFAKYLGISDAEVEAPENACPAAIDIGDALYPWYRRTPVAFALGVHTASEITSAKEFAAWHDVFLQFPEYGLSPGVPEFEYLRAHYVHEPEHIDSARVCVTKYLAVLPAHGEMIRNGARAYLGLYQAMFRELDALIFHQ